MKIIINNNVFDEKTDVETFLLQVKTIESIVKILKQPKFHMFLKALLDVNNLEAVPMHLFSKKDNFDILISNDDKYYGAPIYNKVKFIKMENWETKYVMNNDSNPLLSIKADLLFELVENVFFTISTEYAVITNKYSECRTTN